jgi:hypothetical protein
MTQPFDIQSLVDDLEPVRSVNPKRSMLLPVAAMLLALTVIVLWLGPRADIMAGEPSSMFLLRGGILLLLALSSLWAVVRMASPSVGRHDNNWKVALAAAALFPVAAILVAMKKDPMPEITATRDGMECLRMSVISGLFTAIPMVLLLRHGAPTSPNRAGWVTGFAAGGLGAFAYSMHCPANGIIYIGLWYTLAVGICAVLGRLVVPRLIRW